MHGSLVWSEIGNQPASLVHLVVKVEEVEFMTAGFLAAETYESFFSENPDVTDSADPFGLCELKSSQPATTSNLDIRPNCIMPCSQEKP
jgi:hypothetical protein